MQQNWFAFARKFLFYFPAAPIASPTHLNPIFFSSFSSKKEKRRKCMGGGNERKSAMQKRKQKWVNRKLIVSSARESLFLRISVKRRSKLPVKSAKKRFFELFFYRMRIKIVSLTKTKIWWNYKIHLKIKRWGNMLLINKILECGENFWALNTRWKRKLPAQMYFNFV